MRRLMGGGLATILAVLWLVVAVSAQVSPLQLVSAGDGTLFVLANGVRHRIVPAVMSDADLGAIPEAEAWDAGTLAAALGAAGSNAGASSGVMLPATAGTGTAADDPDARCLRLATDLAIQHNTGPEAFAVMNAFCRRVARQDGDRGITCFEWTIGQGVLLLRQTGSVLTEEKAESLYRGCVGR